jgi:hypothetical protein
MLAAYSDLRFPGGPSPCPGHYSLAFDYYAASALCPARWHARVPPERAKQFQSSPVPRERVGATRSSPAIRRVSGGRTLIDV